MDISKQTVAGEMPVKLTQAEKVLKAFEDFDGNWVNGQYFLRELYLSQFHARIFELQNKGYNIVTSDFTDDFGFRSYKLLDNKETI